MLVNDGEKYTRSHKNDTDADNWNDRFHIIH